MPQFFLSRAVGHDDRYVDRFFRDLSAKVEELAGTHGDIGYMRPPDGPPWPSEVLEALTSCQVFVELRSPASVLSRRCAGERAVFEERLRRQAAVTGQAVEALIPLVWAEDPLGPHAEGEKVGELIRHRAERDRYEDCVAAVAHRVVDLVAQDRLPKADADLDLAALVAAEIGVDAARQVHFVVAAASNEEMARIRDDLRYYGAKARDWHPYDPAGYAPPLADQARGVAADLLFGSDVTDLRGLAQRVESARQNNHIVVLLLDLWVIRLEGRRRQLSTLAGSGEATVAVLAPLSDADAETVSNREELRSDLSRAVTGEITERDAPTRLEIGSSEAFVENLISALEEAQNRVFSRGRVFRRPAVESAVSRPILQGP
ncbi:FxsC protein [Dactylosporangium sp. CS-047395]|uniref:FxsC protein n=1 Tax=Dactylosporangium sp. CS-047395 TaxID=3239936 RepID=UPI003D9054AF